MATPDRVDIPPLAPRIPPGVAAERLLASNLAALSACDSDLGRRVAQATAPAAVHGPPIVEARGGRDLPAPEGRGLLAFPPPDGRGTPAGAGGPGGGGGPEAVTVIAALSGMPTVVAGRIHLHSAVDPTAEAALQAERVPAGTERVMALGFGAGHLLAALLARPELRRLDVVPLNLGVLRAVAAAVDLKPLLCDPRLRFVWDEKTALAAPFVAVPPLLRLADPPRAALCQAAAAALQREALAAPPQAERKTTHA